MIDFLCQTKILLLKMLKLLKILGFFQNFSNLKLFLSKLSNSRFPGKVATLYNIKLIKNRILRLDSFKNTFIIVYLLSINVFK